MNGTLNAPAWLDTTRAVIETPDELDLVAAPRLRYALLDLAEAGCHRIVIDMTGTSFMDSTGMGVLVGGIKRARAAGGALVLAAAPERILRTLRITGLTKILPCFATLAEAFAYFDETAARP